MRAPDLILLFLLFILFSSSLVADELTTDPKKIWEAECFCCRPPPPRQFRDLEENVVVDLLNPVYEDGVLTTDEGGVLTAPELRVQATHIVYTRNLNNDPPVFTVYCEGNLLIDYEEWVLIGDALYYDFISQTGYLVKGRTASPPWYVGGDEILFLPNRDLVILDGYVTTSEGEKEDIVVRSPYLRLTPNRVLSAGNIKGYIQSVPVFWLPKFNLDLKNVGTSPFGVKFGWGGFLGSHLSVLYRFLSWKELYGTARIDGFFGKGIGGGIETAYNPKFRPTQWYSRNYYAQDIPLDNPIRRDRYRFQGTYFDRFRGITINGMYDFVSDAQMAADFQTKDFDLKTAGRTQIEFRREEKSWIANLFTNVRVNDFQSVNQELPSFQMHWHPFEIPGSGIIVENTFKGSYLNYVFTDEVDASDFHSGRVSVRPRIYRPFYLGPFTTTPEAGFIGIGYSNSPGGKSAGQAIGDFGVKVETALSKGSECWKHVVEPYLHYTFLTSPTVDLDRHFIFTINDGYHLYNVIRVGARNSFFMKGHCGIERPLWIDLWTNAFFATSNVSQTIPKGYLNIEWQPYRRMFVTYDGAWNFHEKEVDFSNIRVDWTWSENIAFGIEYRYRSRFDWRKADFYNFILETARSIEELENSPLSDQRKTFLFRTFVRLNPDWSAKFDLRTGWDRITQNVPRRPYIEYQVELGTILFQHWKFTAIYEKREADNRYSVSLKLAKGPPNYSKACR